MVLRGGVGRHLRVRLAVTGEEGGGRRGGRGRAVCHRIAQLTRPSPPRIRPLRWSTVRAAEALLLSVSSRPVSSRLFSFRPVPSRPLRPDQDPDSTPTDSATARTTRTPPAPPAPPRRTATPGLRVYFLFTHTPARSIGNGVKGAFDCVCSASSALRCVPSRLGAQRFS